jgi:glycosyl transferase family 25
MRHSLSRAGVSFERIPAVAGAGLSLHERKEFIDARRNCRLTPGEIGCFLSHQKAWRSFIQADEPWAAIFEDDAIVSPRLGAFLEEIPNKIASGLIKIETMRYEVEVGPRISTIAGLELCELRSDHPGLAGYLVDRATATFLLEITAREYGPIDSIFTSRYLALPNLRIMQVVPALVVQSNIADGRFPSLMDRPPRPQRRRRGPIGLFLRSIERKVRPVVKAVKYFIAGKRVLVIPLAEEDAQPRLTASVRVIADQGS